MTPAPAPPMPPLSAQPGWPMAESPFHAGELAIQTRLGVAAKMDGQGRRAVRDHMPEQHREFFAQLHFLLLGAADDDGQPWATILAGHPGFLGSPDARSLSIGAPLLADDPLKNALAAGSDVGLLGIELPTRRRNRLNGTLSAVSPSGMMLAVGQSFGNCPQYIQTREPRFVAEPFAEPTIPADHATSLSGADHALISAADTFFIATVNAREDARHAKGADVSHRGGKPGFVQIEGDTLTMPDFVGNFLFNTMGNLLVEPRAGLLFIDWETGLLLHLAGKAEVIWDGAELRAFAGAERLLRFHVERVVRRPAALPLRFSAAGYSPLLSRTGDWREAEKTIAAERDRSAWRPFRIVDTFDESATIRSFRLEPADGGGVAGHEPGQHLPIRLPAGEGGAPLLRSYTLSDARDGRSYRLSIKREGAASRWLHETAVAGSLIEALAPRGAFTFDHESRRPAVLISAGVGITPMMAMLNSLLVNEGRTRHHAPIFFLHGARNAAEQAFAGHLRMKAQKHSNLRLHIRFSNPGPEDRLGENHDSVGRVDIDLLKTVLPFDDYDFYLCGPGGFMQGLYDGLRALNVPDERINFESFGPSSVKRAKAMLQAATATGDDGEEAIEVNFALSGKRVLWKPGDGSLLDLAEANGLSPVYSCRVGLCGTCATKIVAGAVDYAGEPVAPIETGEALICCSRPHAGPHLEGSQHREGVTLNL